MKLYYKGRVLTTAIVLLLAVGIPGCGRETGTTEPSEEITADSIKAGEEEEKRSKSSEDEKAEENHPKADQEEQNKPKKKAKEENAGKEGTEENKEKDETQQKSKKDEKGEQTKTIGQPNPEANKTQTEKPAAGTAELTGNVSSVGADSFVISKITTEHHDGYDLAVSVAPGASGGELITVYVTDTAVYQYHTVKNGGINPEDIATREGSWEDLREGLVVNLRGHWEGDSFYAEELVIEKFT